MKHMIKSMRLVKCQSMSVLVQYCRLCNLSAFGILKLSSSLNVTSARQSRSVGVLARASLR